MARTLVPIPYRDPAAAFAPFKDVPLALFLHGDGRGPAGRWSFIAPSPAEALIVDEPMPKEALLAAIRGRLAPRATCEGPPLQAGVAGFFAYEAGGLLEAAAPQRRPDGAPFAALARHDTVAAYDHQTREAFISAPDLGAATDLAAMLSQDASAPHPGGGDAAPEPPDRYLGQVEAVRAAIRRGDVFQANVSRLFAGSLGDGDHPYDLFTRLVASSPAPFSAYLRLPDAAIVSNSPERCVSVRPDAEGRLQALTAPIKGTRPRGASAADDARQIAALLASEKERAENLMIVDLMRNDLGRACAVGSVRVPTLFAVETFANVHHLVSTVCGRVAPDKDAVDLFAAIFPAGSITGAPKIAAMQLIDALEDAARGASYGGIGWFGDDGAMDLNVTIRTAICTREGSDWRVAFRAGGGITIDSAPEEELAETEAKAQRLLAAIRGDRP
ncbi:MAG: anthranilate synthase component I family protein [Caulobacterales bacterium]